MSSHLGADVLSPTTRLAPVLHAKASLFHRESGYSTAYLGSSNLTQQAQFTGLEWNVRLSQARNPDALAKMKAVFDSYWASQSFVLMTPTTSAREQSSQKHQMHFVLSPVEVVLRPFQEVLLDELEVSRHQGHHRNLLVAATGTGKTVMAAVDYALSAVTFTESTLTLCCTPGRNPRSESQHVPPRLARSAFGEKWVGRERPQRFEHVFASIQSLRASGVDGIEPDHFDVVVVDEFHHAAAPSYAALLDRVQAAGTAGVNCHPGACRWT